MGNLHAPSVLSAPLAHRSEAAVHSAHSAQGSLLAMSPRVTPEPPSLGTLPRGPRGQVAALTLALYGGLLGGALGLAVANHSSAAPVRVVSVALEGFDAPSASLLPAVSAPLGAAQPAQPAQPALAPTSQPEAPMPTVPAPEAVAPLSQSPVGGTAQGGGQPGGSMTGTTGGGFGGLAGGPSEGAASGVIAPRFDAAYLQNPEPVYPALSKRFGEEGRVLLRVLVNPEGFAEQVELRQSSGHARLDQAALGTVKRWRFTPARRGSERLAAWVLVPLAFQLEA